MRSAIAGDENYVHLFSSEKRKKAERSWIELQEELEWSLDLFRFMSSLKKGRLNSAHGKVNKEDVIAAMKNNVSMSDQEKFLTLLKIHEKLKAQAQ